MGQMEEEEEEEEERRRRCSEEEEKVTETKEHEARRRLLYSTSSQNETSDFVVNNDFFRSQFLDDEIRTEYTHASLFDAEGEDAPFDEKQSNPSYTIPKKTKKELFL